MHSAEREIKRVGYEIKLRTLTVQRITSLNSRLKRITLTGEELKGFKSLSPDDHIKVIFPYPGETQPVLPEFGSTNGPGQRIRSENGRVPLMRDYTPRRYDEKSGELDIEFVLHGDGIGSRWAADAKVGQKLTIGGPRGSTIVPYSFDWYLMIGDETALPSIARRLEELPSGTRALVVAEVEDRSQEIELKTSEAISLYWVHRNGKRPGDSTGLKTQLSEIQFSTGDYFAWIAGEKSCAVELRDFLLTIKGANPAWIKSTGYWQR